MDEIIAPNHNAFIKGRLTFDNIFMAFELMKFIHGAKRAKRKKALVLC